MSPVPSVALEVALVDLCMGEAGEITKAKKKLEKAALRRRSGQASKAKKEKKAEKEIRETEKEDSGTAVPDVQSGEMEEKDATVVAKDLTQESVEESWKDIIKEVPTASTRMSLKGASVESIEGNSVTLGFSSKFHLEKVQDVAARREVEDALHKHFQQVVKVECVLQGEGEAEVSAKGEAEEVNMVEAVAEIFGK